MASLRETLNQKPWLGWAVAGALLIAGVAMYFRLRTGTDPLSPERLRESVTIKFTDTGETVEMARGRVERELRMRTGVLDPGQGITNPKTGKATGFPLDDWEEMIKRINDDRAAKNRGPAPSAPSAPPAPAAPVPPK